MDIFKQKNDSLNEQYSNEVKELYSEGKEELSVIDSDIILNRLAEIGIDLYGWYRIHMDDVYSVVRKDYDTQKDSATNDRIAIQNINKWVINSDEDNYVKLLNVFQGFSEENCNIALIIQNEPESGFKISLGLVNKTAYAEPNVTTRLLNRLQGAIRGNFPGVELDPNVIGLDLGLKEDEVSCIAAFSNIPTEKIDSFSMQSIEKMLDGYDDQKFTVVLIAQPATQDGLAGERLNTLYQYYNELSPFSDIQKSIQISRNSIATEAFTKTRSLSIGVNVGSGQAVEPVSVGGNVSYGVSWSRTSSISRVSGISEGSTATHTDYTIKNTLTHIENQIKRLEESIALGLWNFAGYVLSDKPSVAQNIAYSYVSLTQGKTSYLSSASVNSWARIRNQQEIRVLYDYISNLDHPCFELKNEYKDREEYSLYPQENVNLGLLLSGKELAYAMNMPQRSIKGMPVISTVAFGRNVHVIRRDDKSNPSEIDTVRSNKNCSEQIDIGQIYHMHRGEGTTVMLDRGSLCSHTFITGSTGSGKSNAIYQILSKIDVPFLVVEPAKGEYKKVFGGRADVKVFGTNPQLSPILRINPFSFPPTIHVLEHIDRLVEILNACWPMYAAMPAVLKDSIEKAYVEKGWNLYTSTSVSSNFPSFYDVLSKLPEVIEDSMYSGDTKSDYKGALITRVASLANGLNRTIFCSSKEICDDDLFNSNTIIDLSRIGSVETKSLMMGVIIMKLQEYWINKSVASSINNTLRHVTIIEEAHNILRKTSTAQFQDNANVQGKSVEMISNAIAEMRSYGEGFIIADQAPDLLDDSVIRNTNTKIVFRLPDFIDRKRVGESMSLNDSQITELAKLPTGVAAVYQNDWVESVLCHFDEYPEDNYKVLDFKQNNSINPGEVLFKAIEGTGKDKTSESEREIIIDFIYNLDANATTRVAALEVLGGENFSSEDKDKLVYNLYGGSHIAEILGNSINDVESGKRQALTELRNVYKIFDASICESIMMHILRAIEHIDKDNHIIEEKYTNIDSGGRII